MKSETELFQKDLSAIKTTIHPRHHLNESTVNREEIENMIPTDKTKNKVKLLTYNI